MRIESCGKRNLSGVFVKKTEKAVRKIADKKTESIEQTAEWMKKYQYAEWPANPDKLEQEMKNKITMTLSEEMKQEPAFLGMGIVSSRRGACETSGSQSDMGITRTIFTSCWFC